jgi:hypothetical protein
MDALATCRVARAVRAAAGSLGAVDVALAGVDALALEADAAFGTPRVRVFFVDAAFDRPAGSGAADAVAALIVALARIALFGAGIHRLTHALEARGPFRAASVGILVVDATRDIATGARATNPFAALVVDLACLAVCNAGRIDRRTDVIDARIGWVAAVDIVDTGEPRRAESS